ncbi:YcnI family protein [Streptomyces sp. NBC_00201]|uniref:YcnI family copper-binding membrane protein n=1 Tax=unclassified Streptomyces TaxID=2593676 RepID=UPI002250B557|nr:MULTISPECIES: YcnI family protein [unclassified Streptomyces]MCX5250603.1 YcnI family protein [Streptomyces sp. NBC_00201]MCX5291468.1 YcnI family protein [Streptomyces sp. NBC_00183]
MSATPLTAPPLRGLRRLAVVGALATTGVLAGAGAAFAHVTVHPDSYPQGATDGTLTFRVPNEEDNARTTKVDIVFPADHPIPSVLVTPAAGWTAQVKNTHLKTPIKTDDGDITSAVSEIVWTGGGISPGNYQDFTVAFGQLPSGTDQLAFKALQTYSDGKTVRWIEEQQPGQPEPENPAPTLKLTAAAAAGSNAPDTASTASGKASDSTARTLGVAGLAVGVLGLITGGLGLTRARTTRR